MIDGKRIEYKHFLEQQISHIEKHTAHLQKTSREKFNRETLTSIKTRGMDITREVVDLQGERRKRFLEHLRIDQSNDLNTKKLWHQLIDNLTHEYGVWFEAASYPKFWELDPTENPQRERRRFQRSYCYMEKRFFQEHVPEETIVGPPLSYLFETRYYQNLNSATSLNRNEKIIYSSSCLSVTQNSETKGELVVSSSQVYFVAEEQLVPFSKSKSVNSNMASMVRNHHSSNKTLDSFSFPISDICEMHKRRYMLKDVAIELFLVNGVTRMIAQVSINDRDTLYQLLAKEYYVPVPSDEKLLNLSVLWRHRNLTNFDYLMQLNTLAGRTYLGNYSFL